MRLRFLSIVTIASFATVLILSVTSARAACKRLGFTVNHYGKEGPTADSKRLLDGYIESWTAKRGIKRYKKSKKTVSCYKFLDFGFFDEWTCKAVSEVCFKGPIPPDPTVTADSNKSKAPPKKRVSSNKTAKRTVRRKRQYRKARVRTARRATTRRHIKTSNRPSQEALRIAKARAAARRAEAAAREAELAAKKADERAKRAARAAARAQETARKADELAKKTSVKQDG